MAVDMALFGNPWEHVRLLSDHARNEVLLEFLRKHAPGATVLEVGCGTGLLSCIAARLGAEKVYAVEPTPMFLEAQQMVEANGLSHVVEVIEGSIQKVPPRPCDLVFSELLNADPFVEVVLPAMAAARAWVAPGGRMAPTRLRVYAAAVREGSNAREVRDARAEIGSMARNFDLDLGRLDHLMLHPGPNPQVLHLREVASEPVLVWDLEIGEAVRPSEPVRIELITDEAGPIGGVAVWFEADLDEQLVMHNRPGDPTHWGQLVCPWPVERGFPAGGAIPVRIEVDSEGLVAIPER